MDEKLLDALRSGFIDKEVEATDECLPKILINDPSKNIKVLTNILAELNQCDEFFFSAAFLTDSGFRVLEKALDKLQSKDVKGTIIVSQYQNFTDPKALKMLLDYNNIELRIVPEQEGNMHTKGYIFRKKEEYTIIIGSSNLTADALCKNIEWNVKLTSKNNGSYFNAVISEFNNVLSHSIKVTEDWIDNYKTLYEKTKSNWIKLKYFNFNGKIIGPNNMQIEALKKIKDTRDMGSDRALIISATGTGKTILSALDVKEYKPNKFLFIVHRERIANDAKDSYKYVLGDIDAGLATKGNFANNKYVFAMIQTISKDSILLQYKKDEFDYIVIDEAHRAGADSYQKILNYFTPKFWLGMTATPERTDKPGQIYEIFNHEVAYEIRLQDAMREEMVCPFHYYGIADIELDGKIIDENTDFNKLVDDRRVAHIIAKSKKYGYSGDRVKGLIFTSRKEEAHELSRKFNNLGYSTVALTGEDSDEKRELAIKRLEQDSLENHIDYIFTVDIFNEGIDIPAINQIIMLRPTQSNIIFVQQLGRGLRKNIGKDFLVVIDFIGNYEKNFMIPMALSGSKKYNKDIDRKLVKNGDTILNGESTIYFDEVSERRIYEAIDRANYNNSIILKNAYLELKGKLGRIPTIIEFNEMASVDLMLIIKNKNYRDYHNFLVQKDKEYTRRFNALECKFIEFISRYYISGKRPHELEFIKICLNNEVNILQTFSSYFSEKYDTLSLNDNVKQNIINQMDLSYFTSAEKNIFAGLKFIEDDGNGDYILAKPFKECLANKEFKKFVKEIIYVGLERNEKFYASRYKNTNFNLYEKYTYEDVFRLLNWHKNEVSLNVGGYKYDKDTNTYPVFINYNKPEDISDTTKYEDKFDSPSTLVAITKNKRTESSSDVISFLNSKENGTEVLLFVRKNKDDKESKEFYFLGDTIVENKPKKVKVGGEDALEIIHHLDVPVRTDLYEYLTN